MGLGPALIAAGHLESGNLVLKDDGFHLGITVATGDAALKVEENLNPVPGGAQVSESWMLHLPPCGPLSPAVEDAVTGSPHLSTQAPSAVKAAGKDLRDDLVDIDALRRLGGQP